MSTKKKTTRGKSTKEELSIWPYQVQGGKYVKILQKFVKNLRDEDVANSNGNQKLFLDDVVIAYLLTFFNASIKSLRTIEDFSQTRQGQKHLSIRKICKSTLSDFNALANPERLQPLIHALRKGLDKTQLKRKKKDRDLSSLVAQAVAVDGTFIPALAEVLWAVQNRNQHGSQSYRARIDVMLQVDNWIPEAIVIPEPKQGEADSARQHIQPGKIYLYDRGYNNLKLIADHYRLTDVAHPQVLAEFIIRLKKDVAGKKKSAIGYTTIEERTLTDEDRAAGVVSDRIVQLNSDAARRLKLQNILLREVVIEYEEDGETKTLSLLTNMLDVSAVVIGQLYRYRWQVELFFRWMKSYSNFRHLISQTKNGMQLNLYVAIIGIMLMYLHTGFRPSKYMFAMMSMVTAGGATLEEITPILRNRERRCALDRESQRKRNAKKRAEKMKQQRS
jgi:hypothetical protein